MTPYDRIVIGSGSAGTPSWIRSRGALSIIKVAAFVAVVLTVAGTARVHAQVPQRVIHAIPSLSEEGEHLVVRQISRNTGHVTFATAVRNGILLSLDPSAPVELRALPRINVTNPPASTVVVPDYAFHGGLSNANGAASPVQAPFTDDPLVARVTPIKSVHITELRTRINAIRLGRGLSNFSWTDPALPANTVRIQAVHVAELRTALAQAHAAAGSTAPAYTDNSLAATPLRTLHIMELRAAVRAME